MNRNDTLLFPGWRRYALGGVAAGLVAGLVVIWLTGCSSPARSESSGSYPTYDKWWTAYPVGEHVDGFGVRTYTQLL